MKKWIITLIVSSLALSASANIILGNWDMNDAAGTIARSTTSSGTLGSFSWDDGSIGQTDGLGNYRVSATTATQTYITLATDNTLPITGSDTFTLSMNISSWEWDTGATQNVFQVYLPDNVATIKFLVNANGEGEYSLLSGRNNSDDLFNARNYSLGSTFGGATSAKIDFNPGTGEAAYYIDGQLKESFTDLYFDGTSDLRLGKEFDWGIDNSFVNVDSISLSVVPEPAVIGLIGLVAGSMLFVRRIFLT